MQLQVCGRECGSYWDSPCTYTANYQPVCCARGCLMWEWCLKEAESRCKRGSHPQNKSLGVKTPGPFAHHLTGKKEKLMGFGSPETQGKWKAAKQDSSPTDLCPGLCRQDTTPHSCHSVTVFPEHCWVVLISPLSMQNLEHLLPSVLQPQRKKKSRGMQSQSLSPGIIVRNRGWMQHKEPGYCRMLRTAREAHYHLRRDGHCISVRWSFCESPTQLQSYTDPSSRQGQGQRCLVFLLKLG